MVTISLLESLLNYSGLSPNLNFTMNKDWTISEILWSNSFSWLFYLESLEINGKHARTKDKQSENLDNSNKKRLINKKLLLSLRIRAKQNKERRVNKNLNKSKNLRRVNEIEEGSFFSVKLIDVNMYDSYFYIFLLIE